MAGRPHRGVTDRTGIRRHGTGYQACVSQGRGKRRIFKHFPAGTDVRVMQQWRRDTRAELHVTRKQRATMGTFEYDAERYLKAVTALPTHRERTFLIRFWIDRFGRRNRASITSLEIRTVRDELLTERRPNGKPYAASTVNQRLRALRNLYTVLDGRRAENPVAEVPEAPEPTHAPRALTAEAISAILGHMRERGRTLTAVSQSRIRIRCLASCPITPKQLARLTRADLDFDKGQIRLPARAKGKGAQAAWQPFLPGAREAFADFDAHALYGRFSMSSLGKSFKLAAKHAGYPRVRVYDLRHSTATRLYTATGSLAVVGAFLQHADQRTSATYASGGTQRVMQDAADRLAQQIGATSAEKAQKDSRKLANPARPVARPERPSKSETGEKMP